MKTIQELYNEVMGSEELKAKFVEAANAGKLEALLKEQGCEATLEEVAAFLKAKTEEDAPLSMDELENSAGGSCKAVRGDVAISFSTLGLGCAFATIVSASATAAGTGYVGEEKDGDINLCNLK